MHLSKCNAKNMHQNLATKRKLQISNFRSLLLKGGRLNFM